MSPDKIILAEKTHTVSEADRSSDAEPTTESPNPEAYDNKPNTPHLKTGSFR